jgi:hypothetical protein
MPKELNTSQPTSGLSITARLFQNGATVITSITCSEVETTRFYSGDMPTITAGTYQVVFYTSATTPVADGLIAWNGSAEILVNDLSTATTAGIADAVWDEVMSGHTVNGTYGGQIVRSLNSNNTLQLTGSHHAAADVHEFQPDVITNDAIAASAITEIATGVRTELATELTAITELHLIHGLKSGSTLTVTPTSRSAGAVSQTIGGDGTTSTTVSRD